MAFWGVEVKPGRPYTYLHDSDKGRLHLSQATLGNGSSAKKSILMCKVGDKSPIYLCSLLPEKFETCALNHEFEEEDEVTFSVVGPHTIHLSGFFFGQNQDSDGDYGFDSSEDEDVVEMTSDTDSSLYYDSEDNNEDNFSDGDLGLFPSSHTPNGGVRIEEIVEDEKPTDNKGGPQQPRKKNKSSGSQDRENSEQQIVVRNGDAIPLIESEDEDGFPLSSPLTKSSEEIKDDKNSKSKQKRNAKDDAVHGKTLKRKSDAIGQDGESARETLQASSSSGQATVLVPENDAKEKKRNKKKKNSGNEGENHEITANPSAKPMEVNGSSMDNVTLAETEHDLKLTGEKDKEKKKKRKKNKKQEVAVEKTADQVVNANSSIKGDEKGEPKPFQRRSFANGLLIEELSMGKPDGRRASPGKKVSVHYIGKLKKNGKIFDSNIGRAPFKFRLGIGQVIKGWDVGVTGMRVGDKRRLTIPPAMGYGAAGAGPAIPPNSWLVFEVELIDVN